MNNDQLTEIRELASLAFSPAEIACVLQVDVEEFIECCKNPFSEIGRSYLAGKLKVEAEVRKAVFLLSKQGSGPAQILAMKYLKKQQVDELKF